MANTTQLSILSFNISLAPFLWRPYSRIAAFSKEAVVTNADVINLQEVHTYDTLWLLRKRLRHLPYLAFKPGLFGPKAGLVTFSKRPIELVSFNALSSHKGVLISRLESRVTINNVHLLANTDGDWSPGNRFYALQKEQLAQLNNILTEQTGDVVLTGDFNVARTSDLYDEFVKSGGWIDTAGSDTAPTFHKEFLPKGREPQRIDYVFVKGSLGPGESLRVFTEPIEGRYLSNHIGLSVKLVRQ
jgi:sphingomyelin phosphodiesterase 2